VLRRDEERLRAEGASPAEIHALRAARFGPDAAARLAALDARRAAFGARREAYRAERARLLAEPFADPAARDAALAALRARHFEGAERVRVEALDRMEAP
jgi:lipase chaperone LimK